MSYSYQRSFNAQMRALPKNQRKAAKLAIAASDRQQVSTPSYRPYNIFTPPGSTVPTVGRPMDIDPRYISGIGANAIVNISSILWNGSPAIVWTGDSPVTWNNGLPISVAWSVDNDTAWNASNAIMWGV